MRSALHALVSHRRLAWLLCLALLLPLAQAAGAWHLIRHEIERAGGDEPRHGPAHAQCELCLAANALGTGSLAGEPPAPFLSACPCEAPRADTAATRHDSAATVYRSRAPPPVRA
ncbi:MAG: hypothetical protein LT103_11165 [Burkholderiaceae bacterium]|nr:hypothetical protein [Burkholderiaceae bacterium]